MARVAHAPNALEETELRLEVGQALGGGLREARSNQAAIDSLLVIGRAQSRLEFLVDVAQAVLSKSRYCTHAQSWRPVATALIKDLQRSQEFDQVGGLCLVELREDAVSIALTAA